MKKNKWMIGLLSLCVLLAGVTFGTETASAAYTSKQYEPDRKGSITVHLDDLGTDRGGVTLACYQVGDVDVYEGHLNGFRAADTYQSLGLDLNDLSDSRKHRKAADSLAAYIEKQKSIQPLASVKTDAQGVAAFPDLSQGMYLILQKDGTGVYGTVEAFLISIPYVEEDLYLYDVETETKGALPDQEPPKKDKPTAKTGDEAPITVWVGIGLVSLVVLIAAVYMLKRRKKTD